MLQIKPTDLCIEPNTSCNLRCPSCPSPERLHDIRLATGRGRLSSENLRLLLDGAPEVKSITLSSRGELFLSPELPKIMSLAKERGVSLRCDSGSNMNAISRSTAERMVLTGFRGLNCAIDGATEETYAKYRVGGSLKKVLRAIDDINHFKAKHHSDFPQLTWQYVVFGHNEHEIAKAREMARERDMIFIPKMAWDSNYSPIRNRELVARETGWEYLTREEQFEATGYDYMRVICYSLWRSPRINWDGAVFGCCWNDWKSFSGNAFRDGYNAAINQPDMDVARDLLTGRRSAADPLAADVPCATCPMYRKMLLTGNYLTDKEALGTRSIPYRAARYIYDRSPIMQRIRWAVYMKTGV